MPRIWPLLAVAALSMALGACNRQNDPNAAQPAPGASGKGTAAATGQAAPAGTGLNGGLGAGSANPTQSAGAGPDDGSKNRTTHGSVGNR
jgi:hypothetical protein